MFTAFNDESYPNRILRRSFYDKHTPNLMLGITPIEEEIRSTARFRYSFASKEISSGAGPWVVLLLMHIQDDIHKHSSSRRLASVSGIQTRFSADNWFVDKDQERLLLALRRRLS